MNRKEIRREIDKLAELVEGWEASAEIPALERDLALEQLRRLYEAIRFCQPAAGSVSDAALAASEPFGTAAPEMQAPLPAAADDLESTDTSEVLDLNELLSLGADPALSEEPAAMAEPSSFDSTTVSGPEPSEAPMPVEEIPAAEPVTEPLPSRPTAETAETAENAENAETPAPTSVADTAAPAPAVEPSAPASETVEPAQVAEPQPVAATSVPTFVSETDIAPVSEQPAPAPAVEAAPASASDTSEPTSPASDAKTSKAAPTLFGMEETVRHRHKQRVIMSLYDTPAESESPARETSSRDFTSRGAESSPMTFGLDLDSRSGNARPSAAQQDPGMPDAYEPAEPHHTASEAHAADPTTAAGTVLGEVINHDVQTLADTIAPPRDVASELRRQEPVGDLRRAIGINDKFLLIRDLFDGDGAAYEQALDGLNACADLDDCMIFIAEHYAWNPESDGARLLMELLERKFS